jgi:hypothetical protein
VPDRLAYLPRIGAGGPAIPEHWALVGLADALSMAGDWVRAQTLYRAALERTPNQALIAQHLAAMEAQVRQLSERSSE